MNGYDMLMPFATPVLARRLDGTAELDAALTARLVAESEAEPGVRRAEFGTAWQSEPDLAYRDDPVFQALTQLLFARVEEAMRATLAGLGHPSPPDLDFGLYVWATVMREHDYVAHHDHEEASFSLVYYADAGDADLTRFPSSGLLTFVTPNRVSTEIVGLGVFPASLDVRPVTGGLVFFPGYLHHYVHPYRGQRPRVAISAAVDVRLRQAAALAAGRPAALRA